MDDKIKLLTEKIIEKIPEIQTNDLYHGKMGICLYLFVLARSYKDDEYLINWLNC
jgi:hypothetical protein